MNPISKKGLMFQSCAASTDHQQSACLKESLYEEKIQTALLVLLLLFNNSVTIEITSVF